MLFKYYIIRRVTEEIVYKCNVSKVPNSTFSSQMFNQIRLLLQFVRQLKQSFKIQKQNLSIPKQGDGAQIKKIPELVIKQVKNIRRVNEENIVCVANKLKVFVSKTMQIESSKLKYNYNSYTSLLSDEILFFKFSNPIEKIRE